MFAGLRWAPIHCGQDLGSHSGRNHIAGRKESKRVQRKEEEAVPRIWRQKFVRRGLSGRGCLLSADLPSTDAVGKSKRERDPATLTDPTRWEQRE